MSTSTPEPPPSASLREFLEKWPWYRALSAELRSRVLHTASERKARAGDYIARSGEPSEHWFGLISGFLQMYVIGSDGAETTLYCMREGEWGGDGSLLKREMRRYDLRALTPSHLCLIPAETFEALRSSSIAFNHFLCEILNERMGAFVGMLEASRLKAPEMRLARALLMLADPKGAGSQQLAIPQHELALICGLSRQRVNVALSEFKRHGLVRSESQKSPLIVDVLGLRRYVVAEG
jgi:CRP/FNR family transcriptional regulator, cyclic AMP receptor protein